MTEKKSAPPKLKKVSDPLAAYRMFIRYSNIVFFVIISLLITLATGALFLMVTKQQAATDTSAPAINASFDETTIQKLKSLSKDGSAASTAPPTGRSPFVE